MAALSGPEMKAPGSAGGWLLGNMDAGENQEALDWLAGEEHKAERREAKRYRWMLFFMVIAAFAALTAAWPVIKEWPVVSQLLSVVGH
jgi:hypothetical protein